MEQNFNYREELERARKNLEGLARDGKSETLDAYWEVCCGDVLVAEDCVENGDREWEVAALAKDFLDTAKYLEGYDHMLDNLYLAVSRMITILTDHPRLKLELLEFELLLIRRIESYTGHELDEGEDVMEQIGLYRRNIDRADRGDFDEIEQIGHLKIDPIEWSAWYERIIDDANRKIYALLSGETRGMGFCFAYWHAKEKVLREHYGIKWDSPAIMNPSVLFD